MFTIVRSNGRESVAIASRIEDALALIASNEKEPVGTYQIKDVYHKSYFDEFIMEYKGYSLVNDIYEDDDCVKQHYQIGKYDSEYVQYPKSLKGLSSNSYASFEEALKVFQNTVDTLTESM